MPLQYPLLFPYEISDALRSIKRQKPKDRPDLVSRNQHFGPTKAVVYTVEFQKGNNTMTTIEIDKFDPIAYDDVNLFMMHGPCGLANLQATYNRFVVPYNVELILRYQAHIIVEVCNNTRAIKYLFKYTNKGLDRASVIFKESTSLHKTNEIKNYLDCRYLSAYERLLSHLAEEHNIYFSDSQSILGIISNPDIEKTMFTEWMVTNKIDERGRSFIYANFPTKFTWYKKYKKWEYRKNGRSIGRIICVHPSAGELYYLSLLLNEIKGATIRQDHLLMLSKLNPDQLIIFNEIQQAMNNNKGGMLFVYGRRGTGKTFLWTTIINGIHYEGKILLAIASSGIASLLLLGGKIAHSRFKIPINIGEYSTFIQNGAKIDIINATITQSVLWKECKVFKLETNMRLHRNNIDEQSRNQIREFSQWILQIGDGAIPSIEINDNGNEDEHLIEIPKKLLVENSEDAIQSIIDYVYSELQKNYSNPEYLKQRAIITIYNETIDLINGIIMKKIEAPEQKYVSLDYISKSSTSTNAHEPLYSTEFLNTLKFTNKQKLLLDLTLVTKKQFLVRLSYAMTINKSQGQTLDTMGLFLPRPVFTHGQLHVALSRVTSAIGLKILILDDNGKNANKTKSVVYKEIFDSI
ncbi:DNA helicase protein [Dioscorea alata]|uniref:DNA helicase protein n=1 Tax=Dioscorea alata TaxID=55571 RepID=A0ACB7VVP9_DIOAL|nr:DNA helicase protein [Dioscorea alata]